MKARFTYWKETDGRYLGFLNDCPDHWTQGDDLADLKEQLHDLLELFGAEASAASVPGRSAQREAWAVDRACEEDETTEAGRLSFPWSQHPHLTLIHALASEATGEYPHFVVWSCTSNAPGFRLKAGQHTGCRCRSRRCLGSMHEVCCTAFRRNLVSGR